MVIVFIGPPGCGKGTQANILKESILPDLNILTVSSLLKEKSQDESILGKDIKNKIHKKIICFNQKMFCYKFNLAFENTRWIGTKAVLKKNLLKIIYP